MQVFMASLFVLILVGCKHSHNTVKQSGTDPCQPWASNDTAVVPAYNIMRGALLGTRFNSLEELKSVIQIEYGGNVADSSSCFVCVRHCSNGSEVVSILEEGTSQGDIYKARYGKNFFDRVSVLFNCPYAVVHRKDLERIYALSRWRFEWFGEGDIAFFDLAETSVENINTPDLAFLLPKDSTEKGYLNSFNHITAQAFITTCFSEELADFIADAHERHHHPELIYGNFTEAQLSDLNEGPVDNYVDIINNEWGQELGKQLKEKYQITRKTHWTPQLLTNYLNDLQSYYSWAFRVGFKPFKPDDDVVQRFANKINVVMHGNLI